MHLQALGVAAVKACVCIVGIIAGGRLLIQPLYKKVRRKVVLGCMRGVVGNCVLVRHTRNMCSSSHQHLANGGPLLLLAECPTSPV